MNPYELLGLKPDATPSDIRKAYRRAAKAVHPDAGGDAEAWALVQQAYDVLLDPDLRTRYDQTGEIGAVRADNAHAEEMNFIAAAMQSLFERIEQQRVDIERVDMVAALKQQIGADTQCRRAQIKTMARTVTALRGRFVVRDTAAEPVNRLDGLIATMERALAAQTARAKALDDLAQRALVVLEHYQFKLDQYLPAPMQPRQVGGWSIWSNRP